MRRFLCFILFVLISFVGFSQESGPFKFLGIPVDGTQSQFVSQLRTKGFTYNSRNDGYRGQFNGKTVDVFIHTNHNLVDRVMVEFPGTTEREIRIQFNQLLSQFNESSKYMDLDFNEVIPDDEDISYEMLVHDKRYQASFYYFDQGRDLSEFSNALLDKLSGLLPTDMYNRIKESTAYYLTLSDAERNQVSEVVAQEFEPAMEAMDDDEKVRMVLAYMTAMQDIADGNVWFMIDDSDGPYQILLFYDNPRNRAHGEDL